LPVHVPNIKAHLLNRHIEPAAELQRPGAIPVPESDDAAILARFTRPA